MIRLPPASGFHHQGALAGLVDRSFDFVDLCSEMTKVSTSCSLREDLGETFAGHQDSKEAFLVAARARAALPSTPSRLSDLRRDTAAMLAMLFTRDARDAGLHILKLDIHE